MLATGIKSPIGVKVTGNDLGVIDRIAAEVEQVAKGIPGVTSSLAERLTGGRYVDVQIDRVAAGRYGLNIADVQAVIAGAVGGENVSETVEGLARFPINLRYAREWRDSPQRLAELPIFTPMGQQITLGTVARIAITDGPPMLKSENARPSGWVYVDVRGRDLASVANELRDAIGQQVKLEPGVSITYSGQFEYMERANARLKVVVPATLLIIFVLLYLTFARVDEAGLIMATLPFALTGHLVPVPAELQPVHRHRRGIHRAGRCGGGVRRGDAHLSEAGLGGALPGWPQPNARRTARCDPGRGGAARAPKSNDRRGHPGRPNTHCLEQRYGLGGHESHRSPDAWWDGDRTTAVVVRDSCCVRADAQAAQGACLIA